MKYSIITPVYNRADCIARCLDSVIQNLRWNVELEHIVVDDGSNDKTPIIIQQYASKYKHIKFISFSKNKGTNAARNAAIRSATGNFCVILDSDDYFVDDAIKNINEVIINNTYRHYCFSANDMLEYYQSCNVLRGKKISVLTYDDFLYERIVGDFIHVIETSVMQKYPFNEDLRIYEGVFFKRIYREVDKILFTNIVVTIRERNRKDSISRSTFRNNKVALTKGLKSKLLLLEWFGEDLAKTNEGKHILYKNYIVVLDCYLMLSKYKEFDNVFLEMKMHGFSNISKRFRIIRIFHLGELYFKMGCLYVFFKYKIFHIRIA